MSGERLRAGFQAASASCAKQIGMEVFDVGPDAAASKMARILGGSADLNPRFDLLENVVRRGEVGPLLDAIGEIAGVRISWRKVTPDDLRGEVLREVHGMREQLNLAFEKLGEADELERGRAAG